MASPFGLRACFEPPSSIAGPISARQLADRVEDKTCSYAGLAEALEVPAGGGGNLARANVTDLRGFVLVRKRCCAGTPEQVARRSVRDPGSDKRCTRPDP
ncbi:MAG TPA: hypothetical protein VFI46_14570 [Jiangellaceae bacterium]|nr:hypothetical protein [Jiangellaceae bacterium]